MKPHRPRLLELVFQYERSQRIASRAERVALTWERHVRGEISEAQLRALVHVWATDGEP